MDGIHYLSKLRTVLFKVLKYYNLSKSWVVENSFDLVIDFCFGPPPAFSARWGKLIWPVQKCLIQTSGNERNAAKCVSSLRARASCGWRATGLRAKLLDRAPTRISRMCTTYTHEYKQNTWLNECVIVPGRIMRAGKQTFWSNNMNHHGNVLYSSICSCFSLTTDKKQRLNKSFNLCSLLEHKGIFTARLLRE